MVGTARSATPAPLLFLHIPKTAGTTLRAALRRRLPESEIWERPALQPGEQPSVDRWTTAARDHLLALGPRREHLRLVLAHAAWGLQDVLPSSTIVLTVLRDPIERVLSHHGHLVATTGLTTSLRDWVLAGDPRTTNLQTLLLAGGEVDIERAWSNLVAPETVFGLTEDLDATLLLLRRTIGGPAVFHDRRNVGAARVARHEVSPADLALIESRNALDLELYDRARHAFATRVAEAGGAEAVARDRRHAARARRVDDVAMAVKRAARPVVRRSIGALPGPVRRRVLVRRPGLTP